MSGSTPADLAVTFRSLARREREAVGDTDPATVSTLVAELRSHVAAAGAALGAPGEAEAVATAIERRHPDDWDEATLSILRQEALAAGAVLRQIAAATGSDDDE